MNPTKNSLSGQVQKATSAFINGNENEALILIHDFVARIITNPICVSHVYGSRDLDELCLTIGQQNLSRLDTSPPSSVHEPDRPKVIYIVSRLQRSGGHSRLVLDFIRAQTEKEHIILSTEVGGPSDVKYLGQLLENLGNTRLLRAPRGNYLSRLHWVQSQLLALQPEHVHLFNHHQDSVAVAAMAPGLGLHGSFYHHGDHHFCLGVFSDHLKHIDLHPMGYHCCRGELGINNSYLPLTFEDKSGGPSHTLTPSKKHLTTATAARYNKIEHPYYVNYADLVPEILAATKGNHLHIGKLSPWTLRRLRSNLSQKKINTDRFIYLEWTSSVWRTLQENHVDLYLASFPYGAALTLIEAMGAGLPVILHRHLYSRVLSCLELSYPEAFSWAEPEELLNHLATLTPARLNREGLLARQRYERYHRPEILRSFLADQQQLNLEIPPLTIDFEPRWDEWAAWVDSQISWSNVLRASAFRNLRKARNLLIPWLLHLKTKK